MKSLLQKLSLIPHLKLDLEFDLQVLLFELSVIKDYSKYHVRFQSEEVYYNHWVGRTLIGTGSSYDDVSSPDFSNLNNLHKTELASLMPYTTQCVYSITNTPSLTRIMSLKSGSKIKWHNHKTEGYSKDGVIIHIPLVMPDKAFFRVVNSNYIKGQDVLDTSFIHALRYTPGSVYVFNVDHHHDVINSSLEDRITIMIHASLRDKKLYDLVYNATQKYQGPFL
jgi:hypothetical protein